MDDVLKRPDETQVKGRADLLLLGIKIGEILRYVMLAVVHLKDHPFQVNRFSEAGACDTGLRPSYFPPSAFVGPNLRRSLQRWPVPWAAPRTIASSGVPRPCPPQLAASLGLHTSHDVRRGGVLRGRAREREGTARRFPATPIALRDGEEGCHHGQHNSQPGQPLGEIRAASCRSRNPARLQTSLSVRRPWRRR